MGIVVVQIRRQAAEEFLGGGKVATLEEATSQGAEPQLNLVEPRAVLGREVKHVLVCRVGQEGTPLAAGTQVFFVEGQAVESGHEFANVQTPMRVQVVENPMKSYWFGELCGDMGQMGGEIQAGAGNADVPHDLARGHDEGGDQAARAMTDVFVFTFFGFARLDRNGGIFPLEDLHARLFVAADGQLAVLIQDGSLDVQLADVSRFGVEVGIVAVEPIDTAMRLQVGGLQDPPNRGARHGLLGVAVDQLGGEIVEAPLTGDAIMLGRRAGGQREDFELFIGGKSSVADRTAEHLEDQRDRAGDNVFAKASRCCVRNRTRWQPANWKADPRPPAARPAGNETPRPAEWNELGSKPASVFELRGPRQRAEQRGVA